MDNKLRSELDAAVKSVVDEIAKMKEHGIFPVKDVSGETVTAQSLRADIDKIANDTLKIAVCGLVKAGKSTFLNSILFGREVLPTFPTPCTAKLTFICHTDGKTGFTARFYTKDEFDEMRTGLSENGRRKLKDAMEEAQKAGVSPTQIWGKEESIEGDERFEKLPDYAAEHGRYVPFVKDITIRINRPEIANLFIVDTPGLDDPNPLNSLETERWAKEAHAVIYLMTWRGLAAVDKAFIENSFGVLEKPSSNKVFVITHIDQNEDWGDALAKFKRDYPLSKDCICGYSAYADLLLGCEKRGERLYDDEEEDVADWKMRGFNHDPDDVRKLVAKRLYNGGASLRLDKLRGRIGSCYKNHIKCRQEAIDEIEQRLDNLKLDSRKAKEAADRMRKLREKLQGTFENQSSRAKGIFENGGFTSTAETQTEIENQIERKLTSLEGCQRDAEIMPKIREIKLAAEQIMQTQAASYFDQKIQDAKDAFDGIVRSLRMEVTEMKCDEFVHVADMTGIIEYGKNLIDEIRTMAIDFGRLDDKIHWYNRTRTNIAEVRALFKETVWEYVKTLNEKQNGFVRRCRAEIDEYVGKANERVQNSLRALDSSSEADSSKKEELVKEAEKELATEKARLRQGELAYSSCSLVA